MEGLLTTNINILFSTAPVIPVNARIQFKIALLTLASCLISAQSLPAHRPAADDNFLIGCTSHSLTDDCSLASAHFVDSLCPNECRHFHYNIFQRQYSISTQFHCTKPS